MGTYFNPPLAEECRDFIYRAATLLIGSDLTPAPAEQRGV
jgi:hypothetical protein